MEQLSSSSIADFLAPAVDSPPSPKKLRQLAQQMKRASHLQRHHGHKTASSESSSISSLAPSDRLPWDLALDNLSLVRKTSIRSNDSSTPSWDRPSSIHNFGRGFFHRHAKSKPESSAHSSAASSVYSGDATAGNSPVSSGKEGIIPSIFSRRKPSRDEVAPKRPHISGPFNFQHVGHTQYENASNESCHVTISEGLTGTPTHEFGDISRGPPYNLSSESMGELLNDKHSSRHSTRPPLVPHHTAPASGPRRLLKHIRSQEKLRKSQSQAPPRPPRSPTQQLDYVSSFGPLPPPRVSSRQSDYQDMLETANSVIPINSPTSSEVNQQSSFSPSLSREHSTEELGSYEAIHAAQDGQQLSSTEEKRYSRVIPGARDSTWPLTMSTALIYDSALPDVPEEEEHHGLSRRSRMSLASNNSSLRGSQSVPMLRCVVESHRPTSGVSETLGALGIIGINGLVQAHALSPVHSGTPTRESWEDLIDYCYEHEAEADCDYQWDRPSLDISREGTTPPATVVPALFKAGLGVKHYAMSPNGQASISPTVPDAPSLSPSSNNSSTQLGTEAITPNSAVPNNFSLPRSDRNILYPISLKESKRSSEISTFRESQTFTLSPSLLIPSDYHQQILQHHAEKKQDYTDYEFMVGDHDRFAFHDDAAFSSGNSKSSPLTGHRISTSTTATNSTSRSNSTGRQHRSTNSSWTTLARRTASSTSLKKMAGQLIDDSEPLPSTQSTDVVQEESELAGASRATQDHVPDMIPFPPSTGLKKYHHKSHASESQVRDESAPVSRPRRPRARTTSLSARSPPPVGQYALFPRTHVKAIGDHI
ncbi:hypothetical protein EsDP_00005954 [Epichloe bromicola]|uniref:CRIB domain-containing protein n=1 Tax=Epichloe bromicola TaxID=79588 RepID=A0ABQ0CW73_9HYPO